MSSRRYMTRPRRCSSHASSVGRPITAAITRAGTRLASSATSSARPRAAKRLIWASTIGRITSSRQRASTFGENMRIHQRCRRLCVSPSSRKMTRLPPPPMNSTSVSLSRPDIGRSWFGTYTGRQIVSSPRPISLQPSYEGCKEMGRGDDTIWRPVYVPNHERPMSGLDNETLVEFMGGGGKRVIFLLEGETHSRLHRWWMRMFSPNVLARWREEVIRPIVDAQINRFAARGRAELVAELASRVPARVIAAVMGLPTDDAWLEHLLGLVMYRLELIQRQADRVADPELVA